MPVHITLIAKYVLGFVFAWGGIYVKRWYKDRRETAAQGWPSVEGVIVSAQVKPVPKTTRFDAEVQYTYFLEEYRTGKYHHEFSIEAQADDFVRQLRDKRVQIRYKQSNPNVSVLEQSVVEQHVALAPHFG